MKAANTDEYIEQAQTFAQPILTHLRSIIISTGLAIEEQIKWQFPCFVYKGKILCNMAAFKQHCTFGFWQASLLSDPQRILQIGEGNSGMGQFGKITSLSDLPNPEVLRQYIIEAASLVDAGISKAKKPAASKTKIVMPENFSKALQKKNTALDAFNRMSPSHQREFIDFIQEAKREDTQIRRIEKSIELLNQNKSLNDKYKR